MVKTKEMALKTTSLDQQESKAIEAFVGQLMEAFPTKIRLIALYGSKSRQDSTPDSDIDILVLVSEEGRSLRREIIDIGSQFSLEYDVLLSPHVIGEARFRQKRGFSYYRNVAQDAIQLTIQRGKLALSPGISLV